MKMLTTDRFTYTDIIPADVQFSNYWNHHILHQPESNLTLFLTPKCGNSSVKRTIFEGMPDETGQHSSFIWLSPDEAFGRFHSAYKFGLIRHPVQRIYSCWKDKVVGMAPRYAEFHGLSFRGFLKNIDPIDELRDMHHRSMKSSMCGDMDSIFDIRDIYTSRWEEFVEVMARHNIMIETKYHLHQTENESQIGFQDVKMVYDLYRSDFDYPGYA